MSEKPQVYTVSCKATHLQITLALVVTLKTPSSFANNSTASTSKKANGYFSGFHKTPRQFWFRV